MKAKFRSEQSPNPCISCKKFTKGQAGIFCNRKPGHYADFIKERGKPKNHDTVCRFFTAKFFIYPCLSLWQPWAWAVIYAGKDIENRPRPWNYRGEFLVHAAQKRLSDNDWEELQDYFKTKFKVDLPETDRLNFGGFVGKANIVDCVTQSDSPWFEKGKRGLVLKNQKPIKFISYKAQQGVFYYRSEVKL